MVSVARRVCLLSIAAEKEAYWARLAVDAAIDADLNKLEQLYRSGILADHVLSC